MTPDSIPHDIDANTYADEAQTIVELTRLAALSAQDRARISSRATALVKEIRTQSKPGLMEVFLAEYGLSTDEGIALMCLAEALLRVPDPDTIDALIEDKIAPSDWARHLGHSVSPLVNASTWALMLTGKVLKDDKPGPVRQLRNALKRLGEPVIRRAVGRAMKEMGRQFVLGETIEAAMARAARGMQAKGYTYSYDMLGEAACTERDARRYHLAYSRAISAIAEACVHDDIRSNPGISVKLSALHPRYEVAQRDRVMTDLVPRLRALALLAKSANMGLNIDAEEAARLGLSLEVIEAVLSEPALKGWDGFGVVVQAYGKRAAPVIDWLYALAQRLDRRIMVRLVKGAYWDTEIKLAQVKGLDSFPVFTAKAATDVSYLANARKLLAMTDHIYPQFATHNAHTVAAVLDMASDKDSFEFQRLHGMGESLHELVRHQNGTRCRIYAPVGAHRDLLAYLVRRLLENGANSSFVNQIVDEDVAAEIVARDPFDALADKHPPLPSGHDLFQPERLNSRGFDLDHRPTLERIDAQRTQFRATTWAAQPLVVGGAQPEAVLPVKNPARPYDVPGTVAPASLRDVDTALSKANPWTDDVATRRDVLNRAADLYEANYAEIFALLAREAGKSQADALAEVREAVDFLRYYAAQMTDDAPLGTMCCISPWNFPLAIFTGQIAASLAAGNAVLAKPAEQTPLIAWRAVQWLHEAGVPHAALQLLPGGGEIGARLTSDARVDGVAFTGSTATALKIRAAMAANLAPGAPLIAETGGLNAMIVDSTALPEQAIAAIMQSAFQSAGQRCSALRCLYVQQDIAEDFIRMLKGAMDEITLGDPWELSTDCGPVIDAQAHDAILAHIDAAAADGRLLHRLNIPATGHFIAPSLIRLNGISEMTKEIFGPVLHVATFASEKINAVIKEINATGYGLTFGLMTRIDDRVQQVAEAVNAGNIYVNRNQIGAVVGSQPFGGEGMSGTGPKAGGALYMTRLRGQTRVTPPTSAQAWEADMSVQALEKALNSAPRDVAGTTTTLPGPTGESNRLTLTTRAPLICLGPGPDIAEQQAEAIKALGGHPVVATGKVDASVLAQLEGFGGLVFWGDDETARTYDAALAARQGEILPLIRAMPDVARIWTERHICVDTTAAGGNTALLGSMA